MSLPEEITRHKVTVSIGLLVFIIGIIVAVALEWDNIQDHKKQADERYKEFIKLKEKYDEQH